MERSKEPKTKKKFKFSIGTFGILLCVILFVAILSWITNGQGYVNAAGEEASVSGATLAQIFMSPIKGFQDAIGVIGFVFCLGAFLALTNATGALDNGIKALVRKLHGHELILIPVLMFVFSVCGTTYGMCEETVGFYIILASTMYAAGMDPIVGCATVLLGAGVGVLGSTVNPFAVGAAVDAANKVGVTVNQGPILLQGLILWIVTYVIATVFVMLYARKVLKNKGSTFLSLQELQECDETYGEAGKDLESSKLTGRQIAVLCIFGFTFLVMIISFIPWWSFEATTGFYDWCAKYLSWLTGNSFGDWYFDEAAMWFLAMGIIIGLVGMPKRGEMAKVITTGFVDMINVNLVIALARAATVLMSATGFGGWLVYSAVNGLSASGMPGWCFIMLDYVLHLGLSFLVPSSSGLAGLSSPIVSPIMNGLGWSVETSIMTMVAANGVVNLITPTNGAIMGGLAIAHVKYSTWVKWAWKPVLVIAGAVLVLVTVFMFVF